jgi:hypothetical protein
MRIATKLATPFVVTVALMGCSAAGPSIGPTVNPPEPEPIQENPPGPMPEPTTAEPEPPAPQPQTDLPAPGPADKVEARKDGTCWVYPDVDCPPPPVTCNPPPPRQVQCPAEE